MPEGPEIHRAADRISAALTGHTLSRLFFAFPELKPFEASLYNKKVLSVRARGKAIIIQFDDGHHLYSHNQLYGRWNIITGCEYPASSRSLRVALHTKDQAALLYSASDIAVLNEHELQKHPYLSQLGPDLLAAETDLDTVIDRLSQSIYKRRCLMSLLQDQKVLAGMGNYLCCETLHVSGIHPQQHLVDLDNEKLQLLASTCLGLTRQSYKTGGITNAQERADALRKKSVAFEDYRFRVYRRTGQPCYQCATPIIKGKFCGRMGYLCPTCQKA